MELLGEASRREDSCVPLFKKVPEQAFFKRENNSLIRLGKFAQVKPLRCGESSAVVRQSLRGGLPHEELPKGFPAVGDWC